MVSSKIMTTILELGNHIRTTKQLTARGYSTSRLRALTHKGELHKIRRGIYCKKKVWDALNTHDRYRAEIFAHYLACPALQAFSHQTAALLHGLALMSSPENIHIIGTSKSGASLKGINYHRASSISRITVEGMPVTDLLQTTADCVRSLPLLEALVVADSALAKGLPEQELRESLNAVKGKGSRIASQVAQLMSARCESPGESITRFFLHEHHYPVPTEQLVVRKDGRTYRPDFAWEDYRIILEFDGNIKYTAFGSSEDVYARQNEREAWLRAQGWNVVRTSWSEVRYYPHRLRAKLDAAFEAAKARS